MERVLRDPIVVEVTRGARIESRHLVSASVVDGDGVEIVGFGDTLTPVFPRSAIKAMQAVPLIESGAADSLGLGDKELALASASHSGEIAHVELASSMLKACGLDENALECGSHWPLNVDATIALAGGSGRPSSLHNNCSGKHAGFLCLCCETGIDHRHYVEAEHPAQEMVRRTVEDITGFEHSDVNSAIDGCSIPTYAVPLKNLAQGVARMITGVGLETRRAQAARRVINACMAEPYFVAGTDRACTKLMSLAPGRVFAKVGAEGVYCAAIPETGMAIALKCHDGTVRAAEACVAWLLAQQIERDGALQAELIKLSNPKVMNWKGLDVGDVRVAPTRC